MNPFTLFKIIIKRPSNNDGKEEPEEFIYYVYEDCNFPEKVLKQVMKEYYKDEDDNALFWQEIRIVPLEGSLIKN